MEQTLLNVLLVISGGCLVLDTKQLSKAIGMNYTTISEMRGLGEFPIRHILRGKRPVYPVQNVLSYLMDKPQEEGAQKRPKPAKQKSGYKLGSAGLPDMSRMAFMSGLMAHCEKLASDAEMARKGLNSLIQAEKLQADLSNKGESSIKPKGKV